MALSHIGAQANVASISPPDGGVEAHFCAAFYDQARTEMLEPGNWAFSLKRASLPPVTNDSEAWTFAYALPSDCMRALRVRLGRTIFEEDSAYYSPDDNDGAPFTIEGRTLYTNSEEPTLLYVNDVQDPFKFTPTFVTALSYLLASYLAGPIIRGNEGIRIGDAMRQRATALASASAASAANASTTPHEFLPSSIEARR
jgi:hypothetical protein